MDTSFYIIAIASCIVYDAIYILRCLTCNEFHHLSSSCDKSISCPRCSENHKNVAADHAVWDGQKCTASIREMELSVVPIHKHPKYLLDCCQLINSEWKRSETARLHGLESSSDKLPTSLILLKDNKVIGHIKLSTIPSIPEGCFVESVVIDSKLRGKGYGTILMEKAEEYCKHVLNIVTIYLSTKGQEQFYNKLGYSECSPISIYGSYVPKTIAPQCVLDNSDNQKNGTVKNAPPPPPLPTNTSTTSIKTFMKKEL